MQIKEPTCDSCKWLEVIPFTGCVCMNEKSDYYHCDSDPDKDICIDYEEMK